MSIRSKASVGRWRAGRHWTPAPAEADLDEESLALVLADTSLVVTVLGGGEGVSPLVPETETTAFAAILDAGASVPAATEGEAQEAPEAPAPARSRRRR